VPGAFGGNAGRIALDQIRTVGQERLVWRLGSLDPATARNLLEALGEMFAP